MGFEEIYLPKENAVEAALVDGLKIFGAGSLREVVEHIDEAPRSKEDKPVKKIPLQPKTEIIYAKEFKGADFAEIRGQESAKRGLEIAAAGGHNIAMYGPPGTGKTMLARAFSGLLPDLAIKEILEITGIHSVAGTTRGELVYNPPFRAPHHTSSYVSLIGGGTYPKPGEVTLAHRGVLFLDEFPEFEKRVIESLRQPLEDNIVSISRSKASAIFPSNFILVAAMNPCPVRQCGIETESLHMQAFGFDRYKRKLSGPIVDRIDLWVSVGAVDYKKLGEEGDRRAKRAHKRASIRRAQNSRSAIQEIRKRNEDEQRDECERSRNPCEAWCRSEKNSR